MAMLPTWTCESPDPGLRLFTLAHPFLPALPHGGRVLEIGCRDTDWLSRVHRIDPSLQLTGIDWRAHPPVDGCQILQGDVRTLDLPPASLDAVVAISTLEHLGLGHYEHDPIDPEGDQRVMDRVRTWLRPGGWCYADVPYAPEGYWIKGTKCRIYDDAALAVRLGPHQVLGYTDLAATTWRDRPTENARGDRPWWYVAMLFTKECLYETDRP